eukprot:g13929.t1
MNVDIDVDIDIEELLALETELKTQSEVLGQARSGSDTKLGRVRGQIVDVKSLESTRRKASKFCGREPQGALRARHGFDADWMPGGYRDVKLNPVVNQHLCEIQLQLREFFNLRSGQHAVYTWARDLKVRTYISADSLFENLSPVVMEEMAHLARQDWHGSGYCLPNLHLAAGRYDLVEKERRNFQKPRT